MDFGGVGLRVASGAFAPLIKRLFRQDGPGAGLVDQPVRLSQLIRFGSEKRELVERDLRKLSEELIRRAVREMGPHDAPSPDVVTETADLLARSLTCLGDLDMDDVQAVRLGHEALARRLQSRGSRFVSTSAADLHDRLLGLACLHVLNFFTQRSTFVARTLVEQSRQLNDLTARMDLLFERIPHRPTEDARFEQRYAEYVQRAHSRLTIYGLSLYEEREWPLDDAYLSLEARSREDGSDAAAPPQRADRALGGHRRVLLRGLAGSGKTTLVQRLAVATARQDVSEGMTHLVGRVPFILPMRTLTRHGITQRPAPLPEPESFLSAVKCPLATRQPDGWIDRVLAAGRGLLLVDGIDEIPEPEREEARLWVRRLVATYPDNLWLVTARPSAVREEWLGLEEFVELTLAPMGARDVEAFVHQWHRAAPVDSEVAHALLDLVHSRTDLSTLATNPLMCALICALHRERNGYLPRGRKRLYDAALSMLLERRDRERPDPPRTSVELDADTQISLLQKLAYWLITNGRSEMTRDRAASLVERATPLVAAPLGAPQEVLRHLLERSGVLREPTFGAVEFVHRTFQDYLGAREIVEWEHFPALVARAHEDQWEDVVRMAVAHARPVQRGELLTALVERGELQPEHRVRLHLLAMASLDNAAQLSPDVRAMVVARAEQFVPPRVVEEAFTLATAGSIALDLLPDPSDLTDEEAHATVLAASRLPSDAALTRLRAFREHPSLAVQERLAAGWSRFETHRYFDEIISHLSQRYELVLPATSHEELRLLGTLPDVSRVSLRGDYTVEDILLPLGDRPISTLALRDNGLLRDLSFLRTFGELRWLILDDCLGVSDISVLGELPLDTLRIYGEGDTWAPEGVQSLTSLRSLHIGVAVPRPYPDTLPWQAPLEELGLPMEPPRLTEVGAWPELRRLDLRASRRSLDSIEWRSIARLPKLRRLLVNPVTLSSLALSGVRLPSVESIRVDSTAPAVGVDLEHLVDALPTARSLTLNVDAEDFGSLAGLPHLRSLTLLRPSGLVNVPPGVEVEAPPAPRY